MSRFSGHRVTWMFELDQQAEQTPAAVAGTLRWYAQSDVLLIKVAHGSAWQSQNKINSVNDWYWWHDSLRALGVQAIPWVEVNTAADAAFHAAINPVLVVDIEPTSGQGDFWLGGDPTPYFQALQQAGIEVWASPDVRPAAWSAVNIDGWAGLVAGWLPQLYWTDFQSRPWAVLDDLIHTLRAGGPLRPVVPTLPWNATPDDLWQANRAFRGLGCEGVALWRLGSADPAGLRAFSALEA